MRKFSIQKDTLQTHRCRACLGGTETEDRMTRWILNILSFLFPPRLPGPIKDWQDENEAWLHEQGSAGPALKRKYRNGIERQRAEDTLEKSI